MAKQRWNQIIRYFHIWDPTLDHCVRLDKVRPHEKVNPLWKLLTPSFQTGQTKREENEEKGQEKEISSYEDPKPRDLKLSNPDILDLEIDDSMLLDPEILNLDPEFQQTLHSIQELRRDIHKIGFQDRTIRKESFSLLGRTLRSYYL